MTLSPLVILVLGIAIVLGLILVLKVNAFLALLTAAITVSLLAPGETADKIDRVAAAFGNGAKSIGIVIALAAIIGQCMMDSGAADRIVRGFLRLLGIKRSPWALLASGYILAIPVFFDTVFYLLVPLARSFYRRTGGNYVKCLLAIAAGGAVTHTLVPPTPGPLAIAATLKIDLGMMIGVGAIVALPSAIVGLAFGALMDRVMPIPMRPLSDRPDPEPLPDEALPPLSLSLLPVLLPVILIAFNTAASSLGKAGYETWASLAPFAAVVGNPNLALLISTAIAIGLYVAQRRPSAEEMGRQVETALMSGGVIIPITAAGMAFGDMLKAAQVGPAIQNLFTGQNGSDSATGLQWLVFGFGLAAVLKIAQGSSTAAMIIGGSMMASMVNTDALDFHPVYLATSIASGSLVGSWMNDSGFWVFTKMGGLTETEGLKTWTPLLCVLGATGFTTSILLALVMPLKAV
jgi:GntP family gluconate:H+ symporter